MPLTGDFMTDKSRSKPRGRAASRPERSAARTVPRAKVQRNDRNELVNYVDLRDRLRKDIVSCELAPGQRLKFEELRARYDAGIGSLREALMQLGADGLVVGESNRGFCVAPVSIADLEDITELRVDIEKKALTQSIQHGGDAWEADIVASLHLVVKLAPEVSNNHGTRELWEERHGRFHDALVAACPSPWLLRFRKVLFVQSQRYRALSMLQSEHPGRLNDHRALMEVVLARDIPQATAAMEEHVRHTADNVRVWLAAHGGGSTTEFAQDRETRRSSVVVGTG